VDDTNYQAPDPADLAKVAAYGQGPSRKPKANENEIFNGKALFSPSPGTQN